MYKPRGFGRYAGRFRKTVPPQPKVETESPMGSLRPNYLASLNATVMRTDFLDFAMAHTGVRLYLDKERSLEPIVQAHADTKNLSFHYK